MKSGQGWKRWVMTLGLAGASFCLVGAATVWMFDGPVLFAQTQEKPATSDKGESPDLYSYMGAESCSGSACHGNSAPRTKLKIAQNEFYIWSQKDLHSKGYEVLLGADGKRMAQLLKIEKPEKSQRCLACHAVDTDNARQGTLYDMAEGVSCEGCHGAAERWLGPHIRKDWDAKRAADLGMYNTKDLGKRAEKCLTCHMGTGSDIVDHELIGAGHPRLKFELDNYSHAMPAHWLPSKEKAERDWVGARAWAISQAVALKTQLQLLVGSRKTRQVMWPDLIHFDCYACHHGVVDRVRDLTEEDKKDQRWRTRDYGGKPGRLVWNAGHYTVFRYFVQQAMPDQAKVLDQAVTAFHEGLTGKRSPEGFDAQLNRLAELSAQLVPRVSQYKFTPQNTWALMRSISGDGRTIAMAGFQSAEQAVLALASLYDAYAEVAGPGPDAKGIKDTIDALYQDIKDGRAYHPLQFEKDLKRLNGYLARDPHAS
jgi:hypothetical protein